MIALAKPGHAAADFGDQADTLMTQDAPRRAGRHIALQNVKVGATNRRLGDFYNRVAWVQDFRIRDLIDTDLLFSMPAKCFHAKTPTSNQIANSDRMRA